MSVFGSVGMTMAVLCSAHGHDYGQDHRNDLCHDLGDGHGQDHDGRQVHFTVGVLTRTSIREKLRDMFNEFYRVRKHNTQWY